MEDRVEKRWMKLSYRLGQARVSVDNDVYR